MAMILLKVDAIQLEMSKICTHFQQFMKMYEIIDVDFMLKSIKPKSKFPSPDEKLLCADAEVWNEFFIIRQMKMLVLALKNTSAAQNNAPTKSSIDS